MASRTEEDPSAGPELAGEQAYSPAVVTPRENWLQFPAVRSLLMFRRIDWEGERDDASSRGSCINYGRQPPQALGRHWGGAGVGGEGVAT